MDNATFTTNTKFYKTTFPSDMIFTKSDASTNYDQVDKLTREFNINYRAFIGSLICLLPAIVDLIFALHKLAKISSNPGKVHFEVLLHLLRYIRENKTLTLNHYSEMKDAPLSDILRQANTNTENQLMDFSDYSCKDCPDTGRSTGSYIIFYQVGPIAHGTHVPVPVSQSSSESEYNAECTAGMDLTHFRMIIHEILNKDPQI